MTLPAVSVNRYCRFFQQQGVAAVLDYGTGNLRNAGFLADAGFRVYAADLPEQVAKVRGMAAGRGLAGLLDTSDVERSALAVDLVISTYVLNIIPESGKARYLANAARNLRPGGFLLVEARCRTRSGSCGEGCSSHLKCPSCARTYSHQELDLLIAPFGFRRICHYYRRHALAAVYQFMERPPSSSADHDVEDRGSLKT